MRGTLRITLGTAHDPAMPSVIRVQAWTSGRPSAVRAPRKRC